MHNGRQAGGVKSSSAARIAGPAAMPELRFRMRPVPILRLRVTRTSSCILSASEQIASDTCAKIELAVLTSSVPATSGLRPHPRARLRRNRTSVARETGMQRKVMISCAVTGSADTPGRNPAVPVTPAQIAQSAIDAAKAGAAIVHIHVRDPKTTRPSMEPALYTEVVDRIRASGSDVLINLTTGPALAASRADCAICSGVTGTAGLRPGVSAEPVTAHEIMTLRCMPASLATDVRLRRSLPRGWVRSPEVPRRRAGPRQRVRFLRRYH